jgi:hypothetical protein
MEFSILQHRYDIEADSRFLCGPPAGYWQESKWAYMYSIPSFVSFGFRESWRCFPAEIAGRTSVPLSSIVYV